LGYSTDGVEVDVERKWGQGGRGEEGRGRGEGGPSYGTGESGGGWGAGNGWGGLKRNTIPSNDGRKTRGEGVHRRREEKETPHTYANHDRTHSNNKKKSDVVGQRNKLYMSKRYI